MFSTEPEYVIVGSGLTGATLARLLHDAGRTVLVLERRGHAGGNVHDQRHNSGILFHTYGPHYFRTNSEQVWRFVNRFAEFVRFLPSMKVLIDGAVEDWPLRKSQVERIAGADWSPGFVGIPKNFEEACLSRLPRVVYEKFIKGYTEKQWGVQATDLDATLARRVLILKDDECFGSSHLYSALPVQGYTYLLQRMLADIPVILNCDYLKHRNEFCPSRALIFTGPIDEFFGFDRGRLRYRSQRRTHRIIHNPLVQCCLQLNDPSVETSKVRTIEWKHILPEEERLRTPVTLLTEEQPYTPVNPGDYEYPFPDSHNSALYNAYKERAAHIPNLLICGRLGEYRYLDMDQAIARAFFIAGRLLHHQPVGDGGAEQ